MLPDALQILFGSNERVASGVVTDGNESYVFSILLGYLPNL
jgi:hypothetical protein